jgi:hypothetical protein
MSEIPDVLEDINEHRDYYEVIPHVIRADAGLQSVQGSLDRVEWRDEKSYILHGRRFRVEVWIRAATARLKIVDKAASRKGGPEFRLIGEIDQIEVEKAL